MEADRYLKLLDTRKVSITITIIHMVSQITQS